MKNKSLIIFLLIGIAISAIVFFTITGNAFLPKSEYDDPNKENDKIINMFNAQIESEIENHTQTDMHPGFISESRQNTINYLKTIKTIESYARYSATSQQPRNYIELKITFNDGTFAEGIYTGQPCVGLLGPCLLMKVEMNDGKAVKVFTNGIEKKGSPDWIINDLRVIINHAISHDSQQNPLKYYPPEKTKQDYENEWNN